jgi:pyrimidine-nucleoside phosphorylase/thymidine phosphorylase
VRAVDVITKKRDGNALSRDEIAFIIRGYTAATIPDYQMSALLMAIFLRGMSDCELADLTGAMLHSGAILSLDDIPGRKIDKHSTGGVGDKTSLVVAPVLAAAGLVVPMISGRALGHTGGTLDKMESIPGFNVRLTPGRLRAVLRQVGGAIVGQSEDLVPADRKLYALRDVTGTIGSPPLIAASIMSKKLAEGIDGLVLDVKTGSGAFMKREEDAEGLAQAMTGIGRSFGKRIAALVTDMSQPLGTNVGNALEVAECIAVLQGHGSDDLVSLCRELAAHGMVLGEVVGSVEEGRKAFGHLIQSGKALAKFRGMVVAQGGDAGVVDNPARLPQAHKRGEVPAPGSGFVHAIDTERLGNAVRGLGAGRETLASGVDPAVGMQVLKKIGDPVQEGEPLCILHYNEDARHREAVEQVRGSYTIAPGPAARPPLIRKVMKH